MSAAFKLAKKQTLAEGERVEVSSQGGKLWEGETRVTGISIHVSCVVRVARVAWPDEFAVLSDAVVS